MKATSGIIRLSASDLSNHLACSHLTFLDYGLATRTRPAPIWHSPDAWVLQQRGLAHENAYIEHLKCLELSIVNLREVANEAEAHAQTLAGMREGVDVLVQAVLIGSRWFGRADVLRKVPVPSKLGGWSYEVYDCKLAMETKAATILQLSLYSDLLAEIQGKRGEFMYVVPPDDEFRPDAYRILDYAAYYRYVKRHLQDAVENQGALVSTYPEPSEHCAVCRWWSDCDKQRRNDDHLSLVAGISRLQRKQLKEWQVNTVGSLACLPIPLEQRPERGSKSGYVRVREQARVQVEARREQKPVFEVLPVGPEHGFYNLPEPSPGDVFFDLESDPFVGKHGREYLFGLVTNDAAGVADQCRWAISAEDEKQAFEWFVDLVMARWRQYPAMHVYHFTPYEPAALKRLMGRYASREDEIDRMLRARLFVDLHAIVKRSIRAGVEEYSLKTLEQFHHFERKLPLEDARSAMRQLGHALELQELEQIDEQMRLAVAQYNADDCRSTLSLRNWLEHQRATCISAGGVIPRPSPSDGAPPENVDERQQRTAALAAGLREGIPGDADQRSSEQNANWLLSNLLDWHRRELKAEWWEFFRLSELAEEDLLDERAGLAGLRLITRLGVQRNIPTDRYAFEKQETDIRAGDDVCVKGDKVGEVVAIDIAGRMVDIKKSKKTADTHPSAVHVKDVGPTTDVLAECLFRIGSWIAENGVDTPGPYRAARDLLLCHAPRLAGAVTPVVLPSETTVDAAKRLAAVLDHTLLAIQGPPGAGKTYTGARMICELVRQCKRVGITATSHKVIGNLLKEVVAAATESALSGLCCVQKVKKEDKPENDPPHVRTTVDNDETWAAFQAGTNVLAGTQWLWTREDYFEAVDVLFVDEAGQMSLANVIAVAQAAKSVVLLGDPRQLEQPLKGSHPDGAEVSALEHLLDGVQTIPSDRGLFLEETWRLHPRICRFTSEMFYEGRLTSRAGLENQRIEGHPWVEGSGLWFVPVMHEGNQNASPEEVNAIAGLLSELVPSSVKWVNDKGERRPLSLSDVLIVAPYNAQVADLAERIPGGRIGTVDKFQGQQAPIVIYSLTSSSPEDAPRGMEFLYSLNRLNVATSRAQAIVIVVGSPRLLEPECKTPRQMQLANALCRYVELANSLTVIAPGALRYSAGSISSTS